MSKGVSQLNKRTRDSRWAKRLRLLRRKLTVSVRPRTSKPSRRQYHAMLFWKTAGQRSGVCQSSCSDHSREGPTGSGEVKRAQERDNRERERDKERRKEKGRGQTPQLKSTHLHVGEDGVRVECLGAGGVARDSHTPEPPSPLPSRRHCLPVERAQNKRHLLQDPPEIVCSPRQSGK